MSLKLGASSAAFLDFDIMDVLVMLFEPKRRSLIRPLGMHDTTIQSILLTLVRSTLLGKQPRECMPEGTLLNNVQTVMDGHDHPVYRGLLESIQAHLARFSAGIVLLLVCHVSPHHL